MSINLAAKYSVVVYDAKCLHSDCWNVFRLWNLLAKSAETQFDLTDTCPRASNPDMNSPLRAQESNSIFTSENDPGKIIQEKSKGYSSQYRISFVFSEKGREIFSKSGNVKRALNTSLDVNLHAS